jgi:hypothetical protein
MNTEYIKNTIYIYIPVVYTLLFLSITFVRFMARNFNNKFFRKLFLEFMKRKPLQNILDIISFIVGIYAVIGFFTNV